jgi:FixJ family two-component response regulator
MAGGDALPFKSGAEFFADAIAPFADCLVLDDEIYDIPALDMPRRLRQAGSRSKVALFTGCRSPELLKRAQEAGVSEVWETPLIARDLIDFLCKNSRRVGPVPVNIRSYDPGAD